jgi:hypothetical protein
MAAGTGKVALVNSTVALAAAGCPSGPTIIDFVGYGTTANCREGATTSDNAPGPGNNTTSTQRKQAGCQDVNNNLSDFATAAVNPRNTASPSSQCSCSTSYSSMLKLSNDWLRDQLVTLLAAWPPHSAERLGLAESDLSPLFLRLSLRKKSLRGAQRKAIGIPHCAAASRNVNRSVRCVPSFSYFLYKELPHQ